MEFVSKILILTRNHGDHFVRNEVEYQLKIVTECAKNHHFWNRKQLFTLWMQRKDEVKLPSVLDIKFSTYMAKISRRAQTYRNFVQNDFKHLPEFPR